MSGKLKCGYSAVAIISLAMALSLIEPRANAANKDWRTVDVAEAFPGSLADLDNPSATNGGVSGTGTSNKGNFSVNAKGQMAITFVHGTNNTGDVVIGRSNDGKKWERHEISDVDMRNSWYMAGDSAVLALTFTYAGPGPQVQIDDSGDVCLAYLAGNGLATAIWPTEGQALRPADRIVPNFPLERCGLLKMDGPVGWFQLDQHDGHFYLSTVPDPNVNGGFVRVYELAGRQWKEVGKPISATRGSLAWDDVTGDMYLGVEIARAKVNGHFPSVFRWDDAAETWNEIQTPATGLRDAFGITSYPGGGCPTIVAHNGELWAFWWQEGNLLQAAEYVGGTWASCAKSAINELVPGVGYKDVDHDSFGLGNGICHTGPSNWEPQCIGLDAFRDKTNGDLVVFICDGSIGFVIHDGRTYPMVMRRRIGAGTTPDYSYGLVPAHAGQGFNDPVYTAPMCPHIARTFIADGSVYRMGTLHNQTSDASDVFVYKYAPRPYRQIGFEFSADEGPNGEPKVEKVLSDGIAARAGMMAGDLILWVGRDPNDGKQEAPPDNLSPKRVALMAIRFAEPGELPIQIDRDGHQMTLDAEIPK